MKKELVSTHLRLPPDDWNWLRGLAADNYTSTNAQVIRAIRFCREKTDPERAKPAAPATTQASVE